MYTKQLSDLKYEVIFETNEELKKFNNFMNPPKTLKAGEVMKLLNITRVTLCHYLKNGYIKASKINGGQYCYDAESVYKLKESK